MTYVERGLFKRWELTFFLEMCSVLKHRHTYAYAYTQLHTYTFTITKAKRNWFLGI